MELTHLAITGVIRAWLIPQKGGECQAVSLEPATSEPKTLGKKGRELLPGTKVVKN